MSTIDDDEIVGVAILLLAVMTLYFLVAAGGWVK
jgi:hypothetical protein